MSSRVRHITFDTKDPYTLGSFWAQVVGGRLQDDDFPGTRARWSPPTTAWRCSSSRTRTRSR